MKKWSLLLITILGCSKHPVQQEEIRPVLTETVQVSTIRPPLYFSGFSKPEKEINVSFRVGGLIEKFPVIVGQKLHVGELIAELDEKDFILELQNREAAYEAALAEARKSKAQYRRIKTLYESESASRDELDRARAAHEAAKAQVERATAEKGLAEKSLSYTRVFAESSYCEVATKDAEINENVEAGQTIATLNCGTHYEVEVAIPENEISNISEGQQVDVVFNAIADQAFAGTVTEVGVSAAAGTAFPVIVRLNKANDRIRSGMAAKIILYDAQTEPVPTIIVPLEAVGEDKDGNYVYLFESSGDGYGYAMRQPVTIGELRPTGFTIEKGLKEGDEVIIAGLRYLSDGKKVKELKDFHIKKRAG